MEEIKVSEKFEGVSPAQVFESGQAAFADLGMEVVKVRSFAYLLQARQTGPDYQVKANFIVNMVQNECVLTLTSETADQDLLKTLAEKYFQALHKYLAEQ